MPLRQQGQLLLLCLLLGSCLQQEDFDDVTFSESDQTFAFALLKTSLSSDQLTELLDSLELSVNDENVFNLSFEADPFRQSAADFLPSVDIGLPIPLLDSVLRVPLDLIENVSIRRAELTGDEFNFVFNSNRADTLTLIADLPQLVLDGVAYRDTFELPPLGQLITDPVDLDGYVIDLSAGAFTIRYDARTAAGQRVRLPISFFQFSSFDFSYLEGNVSRQVIPVGLDSVEVEIPDSLVSGDFTILNPRLDFRLTNSFGVPAAVTVREAYILLDDGTRRNFESTLLEQEIPIGFPSLAERGEEVTQTISFDRDNSNIVDLISDQLNTIYYDIDIILNPDNREDLVFFIDQGSEALLETMVEFPLEVEVEEVNIQYPLPADFKELDQLKSARIKLVADNGIPLSFTAALRLEDPDGEGQLRIESESGQSVLAAQTNDDGSVANSITSDVYYTIDEETVDQLIQADSVILDVRLQSGRPENRRALIQPGQVLELKVGAEVKTQ